MIRPSHQSQTKQRQAKQWLANKQSAAARIRRCIYLTVVMLICFTAKAETKLFNDFNTLCEAVSIAKGGDTLVLQDGEYTINRAVTFRAGEGGRASEGSGEELPVMVRAENVGGVTLKGNSIAFAMKPGASHVVVSGFKFQLTDETAVKIEGSSHIRVTQCDFELSETDSFDWVVISGTNSHHNRIDHCRFANKIEAGNFISINGNDAGQQSQHDRIDHNQFINTSPRIKNEKEAVRVGWSGVSLSDGFTTIESNYFERCDGDPEIISLKSCKNLVRSNIVVDSQGVLSLRHGDGTDVHSNIMLGIGRKDCGGIRVYGDDHRIYNNYLANLSGNRFSAALAITNGDADDALAGKDLSKHYRPRRIQVINNSFINNAHAIEIGYARSGKKAWKKEPQALLIANNLVSDQSHETPRLVKIYTAPTGCVWKRNLFWHDKTGFDSVSTDALSLNHFKPPRLRTVHNLHLPSDESPAIDSGEKYEFITHDLAGTDRFNLPDIGALESHNDASTLETITNLLPKSR